MVVVLVVVVAVLVMLVMGGGMNRYRFSSVTVIPCNIAISVKL